MAFSKDAWETQRKKLEQIKTQGMLFWRPKNEGKYYIRYFLSPNSDNPYPFILVFTHWVPVGDGTKPIICTELSELDEKKPCPICAKRKELFNSNIIDQVELAKQIRPARAYLQWGFVKEPNAETFDPNPRIVGLPKTPIEQLVETMTAYEDEEEEARPNLFDVKNGRVVILRKSSDGQFAKYTATVSGKVISIAGDPWESKINETKGIMESLSIPTEEEINAALDSINMVVGKDTESSSSFSVDDDLEEMSPPPKTLKTLEKAKPSNQKLSLGSALNAIDED